MPFRAPSPIACLLILGTIGLSWQAMQVVHEAGHVVGAWLTGGEVQHVVLHPLTISRTDVSPNPSPRLVVWLGPVLGVALPVVFWLVMRKVRPTAAYLTRFFAGFCLVANGAYIGVGSIWPVGDAETMRRLGVAAWIMATFGIACVGTGLAMWRGLGLFFGLDGTSRVNRRHAVAMAVGWLLLTGGLLLASS